jgi:hypothetical protein
MSDDCSGRLFPTTTRLRKFTEADPGRVREVGDKDTVERWIDASFTNHTNSPFDGISTVPESFNFEEGLIFHPDPDNDADSTSNFTTGDRDSKRDNVTTLSHLRLSSTVIDLPLITILNTSLVEAAGDDEELTVNTI